jgi:predicted hydrocarbon binding protein
MVGVIHQLFFEFVEKTFGAPAVAAVKRKAGVAEGQEYRMDAAYSDEEWRKIVGAAVELTGLEAEKAETGFARFCGEALSQRMAGFFKASKSTREFLKQQPTIHNMMASSLRDAATKRNIADKFRVEDVNGETVVHYVSPNRHCTLYRGLAEWVAEYYRERIEIREPRCQKRGDSECEIRVKVLGAR